MRMTLWGDLSPKNKEVELKDFSDLQSLIKKLNSKIAEFQQYKTDLEKNTAILSKRYEQLARKCPFNIFVFGAKRANLDGQRQNRSLNEDSSKHIAQLESEITRLLELISNKENLTTQAGMEAAYQNQQTCA